MWFKSVYFFFPAFITVFFFSGVNVKWIANDSFADHSFGFRSEEFYGTLMLNFQQLLNRRHMSFTLAY